MLQVVMNFFETEAGEKIFHALLVIVIGVVTARLVRSALKRFIKRDAPQV